MRRKAQRAASVGDLPLHGRDAAGYTANGELFCLPGDLAPISAVFANKQLFDAAGLQIPSESASNNYTWGNVVE